MAVITAIITATGIEAPKKSPRVASGAWQAVFFQRLAGSIQAEVGSADRQKLSSGRIEHGKSPLWLFAQGILRSNSYRAVTE